MADTDEREEQPETEELKIEPTGQEEPKTPNELETIKAQLKAISDERDRLDRAYKGLQTTVNQKDTELKKASQIHSRLDELDEKLKLFIAAQAFGDGSEEESLEPVAKKKQLLDRYNQMETEQKTKRAKEVQEVQVAELQKVITGYQERVQTLGLTEDDETYWEIYELVTQATPAGLKRADIKLKKMEDAKKVKTDEKPEETLEARTTKLAEDKFRKMLADKGMLDTDVGKPSGGGGRGKEQVLKDYIQGKIPLEKYEKECERLGIKP